MKFKMKPETELAFNETLRIIGMINQDNADRIRELLESSETEEELINKLIDPFASMMLYFNEKNPAPKIDTLQKVIKEEKIIISEKVHLPHIKIGPNGKGILSKKNLMILPLYVRANQQIALKEGKAATNSVTRNIAGQVTGKTAKAGSLTDSEIFTLIGNGSFNIMKEMLGPSSHDLVAKREMKQSIIRTGDVELKSLTDSPQNKKSLRYMSEVLRVYDLDNDLIEPVTK